MKITVQDSHTSLNSQQIRQLESDIGHALPDDYKRFLLAHNGGQLRPETKFSTTEENWHSLHRLFTFDPVDDEHDDIRGYHAGMSEFMPTAFCPIGITSVGDNVYIDLAEERFGSIYVHLHDVPQLSCSVDDQSIEYVCDSFTEFLRVQIIENEPSDWEETDSVCAIVERGELEDLVAYLDNGGDIERRCDRDKTLLMCAVSNYRLDMIRLLIDRGADTEATDHEECTPLHFTIWAHSEDGYRILMDHGVNIEARDENGSTSLILAIQVISPQIAMMLIEAGADVHARNNKGQTPLSSCVNWDDKRLIAPMLKERGAKE